MTCQPSQAIDIMGTLAWTYNRVFAFLMFNRVHGLHVIAIIGIYAISPRTHVHSMYIHVHNMYIWP